MFFFFISSKYKFTVIRRISCEIEILKSDGKEHRKRRIIGEGGQSIGENYIRITDNWGKRLQEKELKKK